MELLTRTEREEAAKVRGIRLKEIKPNPTHRAILIKLVRKKKDVKEYISKDFMNSLVAYGKQMGPAISEWIVRDRSTPLKTSSEAVPLSKSYVVRVEQGTPNIITSPTWPRITSKEVMELYNACRYLAGLQYTISTKYPSNMSPEVSAILRNMSPVDIGDDVTLCDQVRPRANEKQGKFNFGRFIFDDPKQVNQYSDPCVRFTGKFVSVTAIFGTLTNEKFYQIGSNEVVIAGDIPFPSIIELGSPDTDRTDAIITTMKNIHPVTPPPLNASLASHIMFLDPRAPKIDFTLMEREKAGWGGRVVAICGEKSSGKSVLAKSIKEAGHVYIDSDDFGKFLAYCAKTLDSEDTNYYGMLRKEKTTEEKIRKAIEGFWKSVQQSSGSEESIFETIMEMMLLSRRNDCREVNLDLNEPVINPERVRRNAASVGNTFAPVYLDLINGTIPFSKFVNVSNSFLIDQKLRDDWELEAKDIVTFVFTHTEAEIAMVYDTEFACTLKPLYCPEETIRMRKRSGRTVVQLYLYHFYKSLLPRYRIVSVAEIVHGIIGQLPKLTPMTPPDQLTFDVSSIEKSRLENYRQKFRDGRKIKKKDLLAKTFDLWTQKLDKWERCAKLFGMIDVREKRLGKAEILADIENIHKAVGYMFFKLVDTDNLERDLMMTAFKADPTADDYYERLMHVACWFMTSRDIRVDTLKEFVFPAQIPSLSKKQTSDLKARFNIS